MDIWDQCNAILAEAAKHKRPPAKKTVFLLSGRTFCECGEKMYVPSNSPKYVCRKCRNKIPIVNLEESFFEQLRNFFVSPENVNEHVLQGDTVLAEKEELLQIQQRELGRVQKEMDTLYGLLTEGHISKEGFGKRFKSLEERQQQLEESVPRLQAEIDICKVNQLSTEEIVSEAHDLYTLWPKLDMTEKREIVETITEKIVVVTGRSAVVRSAVF